jgi:hypothetical protein
MMDNMKHLDHILNQVHTHLKEDLNRESSPSDDTFALHHDRYDQMVALDTSRHRTLNSLSAAPRSSRVNHAVKALLHEGRVHAEFCERLRLIEKSTLLPDERQQLLQQLESQKADELEGLPLSSHLSLEEHTAVLRALMQEAVDGHVENTLANLQVDLHIQKAS